MKIKDFGFPNLSQYESKMPSKSMSQNTCELSSIFARKMLCHKCADITFVLRFTLLFACRALFFKSLFACILRPKNLPKTLPKRRPNPLKINVKNVLFFNIDFLGFRPRFRRVLGLQDGAKSAALRSSVWRVRAYCILCLH